MKKGKKKEKKDLTFSPLTFLFGNELFDSHSSGGAQASTGQSRARLRCVHWSSLLSRRLAIATKSISQSVHFEELVERFGMLAKVRTSHSKQTPSPQNATNAQRESAGLLVQVNQDSTRFVPWRCAGETYSRARSLTSPF